MQKRLNILQLPIGPLPHCISLIMVTITGHIFINIFQTVHFPAVKITRGNYELSFYTKNLKKFGKKLKQSDRAPLKIGSLSFSIKVNGHSHILYVRQAENFVVFCANCVAKFTYIHCLTKETVRAAERSNIKINVWFEFHIGIIILFTSDNIQSLYVSHAHLGTLV